ncbi:MAG: cysteine hydrolase [Catenulispora sp.]|nr:cysteine hydrolase [Catenulispora sp.]
MSRTAVIVVDMINGYEHEDAERLVPSARRTVPMMRKLIDRARAADVEVIYVNDNLGRWRSQMSDMVREAARGPHADLVEAVCPDEDSLFVVKARHSIFYQTPLEYLLSQHGIDHIVLCGQVTEQCILYSALDAHIRKIDVTVARDAVAHIDPELARAALRMMERNMGAVVAPADEIDLG